MTELNTRSLLLHRAVCPSANQFYLRFGVTPNHFSMESGGICGCDVGGWTGHEVDSVKGRELCFKHLFGVEPFEWCVEESCNPAPYEDISDDTECDMQFSCDNIHSQKINELTLDPLEITEESEASRMILIDAIINGVEIHRGTSPSKRVRLLRPGESAPVRKDSMTRTAEIAFPFGLRESDSFVHDVDPWAGAEALATILHKNEIAKTFKEETLSKEVEDELMSKYLKLRSFGVTREALARGRLGKFAPETEELLAVHQASIDPERIRKVMSGEIVLNLGHLKASTDMSKAPGAPRKPVSSVSRKIFKAIGMSLD